MQKQKRIHMQAVKYKSKCIADSAALHWSFVTAISVIPVFFSFLLLWVGSSSTFAMSDDWKKFFTQDQLALIEANRVPKNCKRGSSSWIDAPDDAEGAQADRWVKNPVKWGQSPGASSHGAGKWAPSQHTWGAVPGRFPITTASVGNVEGEATSASSISSGIAAKVGMVDGAESHMWTNGSAAPIADGVAAKIGVGESPGVSAGILLTQEALNIEDDAVRPNAFTKYTCEVTCRTDDGSPCFF